MNKENLDLKQEAGTQPEAGSDQAGETKEESIKNEADVLKNTQEDNSDKKDESSNKEIDYEAELARVKTERENYKTAFLNEKDKNKRSGSQNRHNDDDDDDKNDRVDLNSEIEKIREELRGEFDQIKSGFIGDAVSGMVQSLSENDKEAELIKYHYENTINKSGVSRDAIERDLRRAKLLANESRIEKQYSQMLRTLESERNKYRGSVAGSQKKDSAQEIELNAQEQQIVERLAQRKGITFAEAKQLFAKSNN